MTPLSQHLAEEEITVAERIVIDYANLSGRESANRAEFRKLVLEKLQAHDLRTLEWVRDWVARELEGLSIQPERLRKGIIEHLSTTLTKEMEEIKTHECCDGECNHDACCGKIEANCPLITSLEKI